MRMLDLFSGIGGFSLAAHWAGIETVAFCEREPFCQKVLQKHWPDIPIVDDIFKLRGDEFGTVDIISGGFPCQPFSVAGRRKGEEDDRHLWPEMLRIISEANPTWVLGENVTGIVSMVLDDVLLDLENIGYETQAIIIPACAVNAPHRRDRVWIVARNSNIRNRNKREKRKISERENTESAGIYKNVADARSARRKWWRFKEKKRSSNSLERCSVSNSRRLIKSRMGRMAYGVSSRMDGCWENEPKEISRTGKAIQNRISRLKAFGNSIVPEVAYQFFSAIMEAENASR